MHAHGRMAQVFAEASDDTARQLVEVAEVMDVSVIPSAFEVLSEAGVPFPLPQSRRPEVWLMMLLGAGFGLGCGTDAGSTDGRPCSRAIRPQGPFCVR